MTCIVYNCSNLSSNTTDISYFPFPKVSPYREKWISFSGWSANQIDLNTANICSQHFEESCYTTEIKIINDTVTYTRILTETAIPTLNSPPHQMVKDSIDFEETVLLDVVPEEECENQDNSEPGNVDHCEKIKTVADLHKLRKSNEALQKKILNIEEKIKSYKTSLPLQIKQHNAIYIELARLNKEYSKVKRSMLSLSEQKNLLAKVFSPTQIKLLGGQKKIFWSDDDMAVAYTIKHLSNTTSYNFLKDKFGIPLPAIKSIDRWVRIGKNGGSAENTSNANEEQTDSIEQ